MTRSAPQGVLGSEQPESSRPMPRAAGNADPAAENGSAADTITRSDPGGNRAPGVGPVFVLPPYFGGKRSMVSLIRRELTEGSV